MNPIIDLQEEREARDFPRCQACDFYEAGRCARLDCPIEADDTCRFHTALVDGPGVGA